MKWMGHINRWGRIEEFALYEKILYKKGRESLWIVYTTRQPLIIKTLQQQIWLKFLLSTLCLNTSCWLYHTGMTRQKFLWLNIAWWPYYSKHDKTTVSMSQHIMMAPPQSHDKTKVSMSQNIMMALSQQGWKDQSFYNSTYHNGPITASMTRLKLQHTMIALSPRAPVLLSKASLAIARLASSLTSRETWQVTDKTLNMLLVLI